jgi:hypothetical protein
MSRLFDRKFIAVAGVIALLSAAGAYAYFSQTGSGSGSAATGSGVPVVVNQTSVIAGLTPGSTAQALSGDFDNANPGRAHVASVTASLYSVTDGAGAPITGCTIADYRINSATATVNQNVASGTAVGSWSGPTIEMLDRDLNQDACKGATVVVHYASV